MPTLEGQDSRPSTRRHRHQVLHQRLQHNRDIHRRHLMWQTLSSLSKDLEGTSAWFTSSFEQAALQS